MKARVFIFLLALSFLASQPHIGCAQQVVFQNNDKICFIGNSITMNGQFYHDIHLYYATRFPQKKLSIFNCGISGDVAGGIIARLDSDVLIHRPNWCVLMIGMNDVNRSLYSKAKDLQPGINELREQALLKYKNNVEQIIKTLIQNHIKIILQKPSIYDQTAVIPAENFFGTNDALYKCSQFLQNMADIYHLPIVDYWSVLNKVNARLQEKDSTATIIGKDRVHPGAPGHLIMAYEFLKDIHSPGIVSAISVTTSNAKTACQNCIIKKFANNDNNYSFDCLEKSLPFPIPADAQSALQLVPFSQGLNIETLKVNDLSNGVYKLLIDNVLIGTFSEADFRNGIDLTQFSNTPQYVQSVNVFHAFENLWKSEAALRSISYGRYKLLSPITDKNDLDAVGRLYEKKKREYASDKDPNGPFYLQMFQKYLTNKPMESVWQQKWISALDTVYKVNKPITHHFVIQKHSEASK